MAIIACPECAKGISDKAPACPHCGTPISLDIQSESTRLTTIQETSKRLKIHIIGAAIFFWGGIAWMILSAKSGSSEPSIIPGFMLLAGFVWYIATKIRIWWHHK